MKWPTVSIAGLFLVILYILNYEIERHQFPLLACCFSFLFFGYYIFCWSKIKLRLSHGLALALIARLLLISATPILSDDVFRFLWDGLLNLNHISPFAHTPEQLATDLPSFLSPELYEALNSKTYYSVYPPLSQVIFSFSAFVSNGNIIGFTIILKLLILIAESGLIFFLIKLLDKLKMARTNVLFYALNPLVIIEAMGSLHFEVFMALCVIISIYYLMRSQWILVALFLAFSIAIKMVSAILWPFFIPWLGLKRWLGYSIVIGLFLTTIFFPLWNSEYLSNYTTSLDLYFRTFEFNASLYYLMRFIGTWIKGYNPIAIIGPLLSLVSFITILWLALVNRSTSIVKNLTLFSLGFTVYLLCATTVHPWYILLPLLMSPLIRIRFIIIWSGLIWLSYYAYGTDFVQESTLLLLIQYLGLFLAIWLDKSLILESFAKASN